MRYILIIPLFFIFSSLFSQAWDDFAKKSTFSVSERSPGYHPLEDLYDVNYYHVDIEVPGDTLQFTASTRILFTALEDIDTLVFELLDEISVENVRFDDDQVNEYEQSGDILYIYPQNQITKASIAGLTIDYHTSEDYNPNSGIYYLYDYTYQQYTTATLSEPFAASGWFPVKQNLRDKADSVTVWITVPLELMAGSNGLLEKITILDENRHRFEWHSEYPTAYYLISISAGNYIDYSFKIPIGDEGDSLLIQNYIYDDPEILDNEKDKIDRTADMIYLFNELIGEYPFKEEKYGHCMAAIGGGMEHQTMTTIQNFNFYLVAHELAHQWFGDNVTCGTWQDIWINEGFASYLEYVAIGKLDSDQNAREWMADAHNRAREKYDAGIFLTEAEAKVGNRIFDYGLSYKKGASILHMLRYEVGNDDIFFRIFKEFQDEFADSVAVADDFLNVTNRITGDDYTWFFDQWYYGKGYPVFNINWANINDSLIIESSQTTSNNETSFFKTHLDLQVSFLEGEDTIIKILQDDPFERYSIYLPGIVTSIIADPDNYVLKSIGIYKSLEKTPDVIVSPNPFNNYLMIQFEEPYKDKTIFLTDLKGKLMYQDKFTSQLVKLDLQKISQGIYILGVRMNGKLYSFRVVKQAQS